MEVLEDIKQHPIFRILLPFVLGIVFYFITKPIIHNYVIITTVFSLVFIIVVFHILAGKYWNYQWLYGAFIYLAFFVFGFIISVQQGKTSDIGIKGEAKILGTVENEPKLKENSVQTRISIEAYETNNEWYATTGFIQLFLEKTDEAAKLKAGDQIIFSPDLQQYENAGNPYEFDYEKYLWQHLISYSDYLTGNEWIKTETYKKFHVKRFAQNIRNSLINIYRENGLEGDELAVATALSLGNKSSLSDNVRQSYSISGGMHVLAVSGLHVGIVFLVINSLLGFLKKKKHLLIKTVLVILLIWFYALITGLSPSVTRASLMFSLFALGKVMKRNPGFLNILSTSALISLIINPFAITEIGFQLSYAAVGSIVFFYPRIYSLITVSNKILDKLWSLVAVSVAAQIGTLPLTIYYFNQFSNYFILTNILLIPLVSIAIYSAILLIVVSPIGFLSVFVGKIFNFIIYLMNTGVSFIESLPWSASTIYIDRFQFVLLIAIILLVVFILEYRKNKLFIPALFCLICFMGNALINKIESINQRDIVVYNIRNTSVINFIDARDNIIVTGVNSNLSDGKNKTFAKYHLRRGLNEEKIVFIEHLNPDYILRNIISINNPHVFLKNGLIGFHNLRLALVGDKLKYPKNPSVKLNVDYVIVTGYKGVSFNELLRSFNFKSVIIDSSVADYYAENITQQLLLAGYNVFNVKESGAFIHSIENEI